MNCKFLEQYTAILHQYLCAKNYSISVAESCTGGLLSYALNYYPGSHTYFKTGVVAYSIESKIHNLRIAASLIKQHGVVSLEVAKQMAHAVKNINHTTIGLSTTGWAGPEGESVGLVYLGFCIQDELFALPYRCLQNNRNAIKTGAVKTSLQTLINRLKNNATS